MEKNDVDWLINQMRRKEMRLDNIWDIAEDEKEKDSVYGSHIKKIQVLQSNDDLLAASCAAYRLRTTSYDIGSILSSTVFQEITASDRAQAREIRDYYRKRIMVLTLKGMILSPFKMDLNKFINTDGKMFTNTMVPLVYRLPEFHEYDVGMDNMVQENCINRSIDDPLPILLGTKTLTPLRSVGVNKKKIKTTQYWMKTEDGEAVCLSMPYNTPLEPIWRKIFGSPELVIKGKFRRIARDDLDFYSISHGWELMNIL